MRGYIAMLATRSEYRGRGIATALVRLAVKKMIEQDADEVRNDNFNSSYEGKVILQPHFRLLWKRRLTIFPLSAFMKT